MKLSIYSSIFLFALATPAFASHNATEYVSGKIYVGAFGGSGSSNNFNASQFGTAFFTEATGGPLSINAFGQLNSKSSPFFGVQLGHQMQDIFINSSSAWRLGPAAELEGLSMSKRSFDGNLINNTTRLEERNFEVSYPMRKTVFLANAVLNFNKPHLAIHPYIGLGIGNAIVRITNASSAQISPAEDGINHYNASTNDSKSTFAGQIKLGLSYGLNKYVSFFAEYRWIYLASTNFAFGSTVYPSHVETSNWQVNLSAQRYNLGNIGIRFNL